MTNEKTVKARWMDVEIFHASAVQKDGSRRLMYCVISSLEFKASRVKNRVLNLSPRRHSELEAWADAIVLVDLIG